ncbi:HCR1 [Candida oxycetoniae]|uniref:Eukaryotic translation initiation factor 3 subunit J n=1 Tax=Candida oxycetoniae TaxID=497107 RepID=A0AAI9T1W0_9ASCO|nr:HCR1 [Candida oxycetoniae]KAI3406995.2 HCR1 [Candida oxycetoniae]
MAWDDDDFDIPTKNKAAVSWEDEEDDDPLLDSWDIDPEEDAKKKKAEKEAEAKRKAEIKAKEEAAKRVKEAKRKELEKFDGLDPATRKEMLRKAELTSDLNNAADLFGGLGVAGDADGGNDDDFDINEHPREKERRRAALLAASKKPALTKDSPLTDHPLFQPVNKQEYEKLRKALGTTLTALNNDSSLLYASSLAIDLIRDLAQPLSLENTRKVISTLNVVLKDKERQERQARLQKAGGTATGGAGKKKAKPAAKTNVGGFKKDGLGGDDFDDDFDDDDFM